MEEPASGPQRPRAANGKAEKEKRKRSRVTPEQLVHLERFFSMDRSPTAARRKEISDMLGMQERQTQIWFQNRRAKAKLQDGKKGRSSIAETPPDTPPQLVTGYEAELHNLLHEDEPVTIIPCTDLSIGAWRRIASIPGEHDLVAYLSDTKRCLTWFIQSSGHGFKMEIPFDIIVNTEFTNAAPGSGLASFYLSQPPTFYLESPPSNPSPGTGQSPHWRNCADWTEDQQATKVLRHNLVGSAVQLAHVLRHLSVHMSGSDIRLHSLGYHSQEPSPPALEIQPPPLASFADTGHHYHHPQDNVDLHQPDHLNLTHKRSFSSPAPSQQLSPHDKSLHHSVERSPSGVIPDPDPPMYSQYPQHPTIEVNPLISYSNHSEPALQHHISHSLHSAGRGNSRSFSPHGSHQRPYSAGSVHSVPYENGSRVLSFHDNLQPLGSDVPTSFGTPSPPLLTTPFYPARSAPSTRTVSPYDPAIPFVSGMPGMSMSHTNSPKTLLQQ
ncbi:hypothetical protein JVT61DRAFT_12088 [Boletus reticuloceps]|uniref:Homeobox domain-containing protein n=1 Tax=Boletus reticuloceps TaxID=495285 RepID=A0A8I2YEP5_9AGAM|nr:hypothetical protein JVT61DRAFT_12088 [Boletus reticuloceps]